MNAFLDSSAAITSWMIFSLVIGGMVVVAALAAHDAQRAANRSVRWVWMTAIVAIVGLSVAAPLRRQPELERVLLPKIALTADASYPRVPASSGLLIGLQRARDAVVTPVALTLDRLERQWWQLPAVFHRAVMIAWMLGATIAIGVLFISYMRIRRRVQRWPVQRIAGVPARIAPTAGPAVVGLSPAEIVLPAWLLGRTDAEQRLVLAHETEHVRAGDPWLLVIACASVACMPWNAALWFAFGRLRLAVELDCDARVLQRGVPASDYGSLLIDLSALRRTLPSAMPAFSCNGSFLERRLVAMTSRRSRFALARRISGGLLAVAALATACSSELPTSAEVEKMDVAAAEKQATRLLLVDSATTRYVVDGYVVTKDSVKEIRASDIASVEVARGNGKTMDEVRVTRLRRGAAMTGDSGTATKRPLTATNMRIMLDTGRQALVVQDSVHAKRTFDGLVVIDNKIVESAALQRLDPAQIESVEVVKGAAATALYSDPRAANGVIRVKLKIRNP